jgi:hypothetical protein
MDVSLSNNFFLKNNYSIHPQIFVMFDFLYQL